ncbi:MAG: phage tail tube protein [Angelakisella sp.]
MVDNIMFPTSVEWKQENAISAGDGAAFLNINGKNVVLFYLKALEAKITKNKQETRVVGRRAVGSKTTSWSGSGNMQIYEVTSAYKEIFLEYVNGGIDVYFSIQVTNTDLQRGREVKLLTGCNFDEIIFAKLADDDSMLEQDIPFTFDGAELLEKFKTI